MGKNKKREPAIRPLAESIRALSSGDRLLIRELRFPNYRSLERDARIRFEFPLTVLLGRNGANKSSVLHALYGSVHGKSIAEFWFETKLDAIPDEQGGVKQSVTHRYLDKKGKEVECIKARAPRHAADPDYWEAVKPTQQYGFPPDAQRVPPIALDVLHLDFRGELPAFDKYFYFPDESHLAHRIQYARAKGKLRREYRKQDYLRRRSGALRRKIDEEGTKLTDEELGVLRYVLERPYQGGTLLEHSLFRGHRGWTILFQVPSVTGSYSDAFAGSGESAATILVHKVLSAAENTLVLLDEPETSLHPRAQRRMLEFLCEQAMKKSLQIVMATHSIHFAEELPPSAIRVLDPTVDGRVRIRDCYSAREALHEIGTFPPGKVIVVEDRRAEHVVASVLRSIAPAAVKETRVVIGGGTSRIYEEIQAHANTGRKDLFVLLDGDHRPTTEIPPDGELPQGEQQIDKLIRKYTKGKNKDGPKLAFRDMEEATRYARFLRDRVRFLPRETPEDLVWDEAAAANVVGRKSLPAKIAQNSDAKERIHEVSLLDPAINEDVVFAGLLSSFLKTKSVERVELESLVDEVRKAP